MKKMFIGALAGMALLSSPVWAQETASAWQWVGSAGLTLGGDTLAGGTYINSGDSFKIKAGGGLSLSVGGAYQVSPDWAVQSTIGYHFDSTNAKNGDITFSRMPIELLGLYSVNDKWRVGAGLRSAGSAKITTSGAASFLGSEKFDNTLGQILEVQYIFGGPQEANVKKARMAIAGRYVMEEFKAQHSGKTFNGNHLGVNLMVYY